MSVLMHPNAIKKVQHRIEGNCGMLQPELLSINFDDIVTIKIGSQKVISDCTHSLHSCTVMFPTLAFLK